MEDKPSTTGLSEVVLRDGTDAEELTDFLEKVQKQSPPETIQEKPGERSFYVANRSVATRRGQQLLVDQPLPTTDCYSFSWVRTDGHLLHRSVANATAIIGAVTPDEVGIAARNAAGEVVAIDKDQAKILLEALKARWQK